MFLPALYLSKGWWIRENWTEKELWVAPSFPFLPGHHFQSMWLADTIRKDLIGFLDCSCFFNAFFLYLLPVVVYQKSVASGAINALTYSVIDVTHLPCTHFKSHWTPAHHESARILCSWGIILVNAIQLRQQGMVGTHVACISSVHMHAPFVPLDFTY